jgi:hypothetical protein
MTTVYSEHSVQAMTQSRQNAKLFLQSSELGLPQHAFPFNHSAFYTVLKTTDWFCNYKMLWQLKADPNIPFYLQAVESLAV